MRQHLDLSPAPLGDIAAEGEAPAVLWRVEGAHPLLALEAADAAPFTLIAGRYAFSVELRAAAPGAPVLRCRCADREVRQFQLTPEGAFGWRGEIVSAQTVTALELSLEGARGTLAIGACRVETEAPASAPELRPALFELVRAAYRKLPRRLRAWIGRRAGSVRGFAGARARALDAQAEAQGRIERSTAAEAGELEAHRADFAARMAVAAGLVERVEPVPAGPPHASVQLVAFYLPQFHRIAENDDWWGPGFTEWSNVAKAVPQFVGHNQPRLPGELGFYDLTAPETLRRQAGLAGEHGVSAFAFHYYWFAGKRLLERPLDGFLADASLRLNFTLCWANENWTRRWDGDETAVLIAQRHDAADHARVFDDMARYLEDERAIRVAGAPLIAVYRPALIEDCRAMTEIWRERAARRGWPGLYLAAADAFQFDAPAAHGFDALVEFPPHGLTPARIDKRLAWLNPEHRGAVFDYAAVAEEAVARLARRNAGVRFPGVMPGWDNEARRPGAGNIFHGANPAAYARWLEAACAAAERDLPADRRLVFVNAWNEWAEGAYLEPDRKWGRAFLEATRAVLAPRI